MSASGTLRPVGSTPLQRQGNTQVCSFLVHIPNDRLYIPEESFMEVSATIQCPYCGQEFDILVDTSVSSQRLVLDCEVCCRPLEASVECEPGEILGLDVTAG